MPAPYLPTLCFALLLVACTAPVREAGKPSGVSRGGGEATPAGWAPRAGAELKSHDFSYRGTTPVAEVVRLQLSGQRTRSPAGQAVWGPLQTAFLSLRGETPAKPDLARVPGVVIDHVPATSGLYIGSPSLAILPKGDYVASHDFFGPKSGEFKSARSGTGPRTPAASAIRWR
jgi:hypothetical protein